jgi:hypothetical protein
MLTPEWGKLVGDRASLCDILKAVKRSDEVARIMRLQCDNAPEALVIESVNLDYSMSMFDSTSAIAATLAASQSQISLLAVRLANDSQRQVVDLLAESVQMAANPPHLGNLVDTSA